MATLPHHDVPRRGTKLYLQPRDDAQPAKPAKTKVPEARPSRIQRMVFIFGASTMMWLGIGALVMAF